MMKNRCFNIPAGIFISLLLIGVSVMAISSSPAALTQDEMKKGKDLLQSKCSICHAAPKPEEHTMKEWPGILKRMGPMANLTQAETDFLLRYIEVAQKKAK